MEHLPLLSGFGVRVPDGAPESPGHQANHPLQPLLRDAVRSPRCSSRVPGRPGSPRPGLAGPIRVAPACSPGAAPRTQNCPPSRRTRGRGARGAGGAGQRRRASAPDRGRAISEPDGGLMRTWPSELGVESPRGLADRADPGNGSHRGPLLPRPLSRSAYRLAIQLIAVGRRFDPGRAHTHRRRARHTPVRAVRP